MKSYDLKTRSRHPRSVADNYLNCLLPTGVCISSKLKSRAELGSKLGTPIWCAAIFNTRVNIFSEWTCVRERERKKRDLLSIGSLPIWAIVGLDQNKARSWKQSLVSHVTGTQVLELSPYSSQVAHKQEAGLGNSLRTQTQALQYVVWVSHAAP